MEKNRTILVAVILFFSCIILLLIHLLSVRLYSPLPVAVFWVSVVTAILVLVFQITRIPWPGHEAFLIVEILMLGFVLHMIYLVPFYELVGTDSYDLMNITKKITEYGTVSLGRWPLLEIEGAGLHYVTGMSLFSIAKYFPTMLATIFVFLLYILTKKVFGDKKIAFFVVLLMVTLERFTFLGSVYHYRIIALPLAMTMFCCLTRQVGTNRIKFTCLAILCSVGLVFAHHATSLIMLIFLLAHLIITYLSHSSRVNSLLRPKQPMLDITGTFVLLTFVILFSYWMYKYNYPLIVFKEWGRILLSGELGIGTFGELEYVIDPQTIASMRGTVLYYGHFLFHAIFALILLYKIFFQPRGRSVDFYSFTFLLGVCGVLGFMFYFVLPKSDFISSPGRMLTNGWIFGFAPLAACILENRPRWSRQAGIILLSAFMVFNIYTIGPIYYDLQWPGRGQGNVVLREDYALAETLAFEPEEAPYQGAAYHKTSMAIWDVQGFRCKRLIYISEIDELEAFDWIVIKKGRLEYLKREGYPKRLEEYYNVDVINRLDELSKGGRPGERNIIYESNLLIVLKQP